jgi:glycosyltransferase involved in cell wall biosynthesis
MAYIKPDRPTAVVFAPTLPHPPRSGLDLRVLATVRALGSDHDVGVFALSGQGARPSSDGLPPWDGPTAAWRVSLRFAADGGEKLRAEALRWLRDRSTHPSDRWYSDAVTAELAQFVNELEARIAVVETLWLHRYIRPLRKLGCAVILDAHGVEGALHDELADSHPSLLAHEFALRTHEVEARAIATADQVWVTSPSDARLMQSRYGSGANIEVVPNAIALESYVPREQTGHRFTVAFMAVFSYPPNIAAARRLLTGIFPSLAEHLPAARLALIGRDPTTEMRDAAKRDSRVQVTGPVEDVAPHLRDADALAVPLTEGHGTRFKVMEAFAAKVPVVSTRKGVEGLEVEPEKHYLSAESDSEFVSALGRLVESPELGARLARHGFEYVARNHSLDVARERVSSALSTLAAGSR